LFPANNDIADYLAEGGEDLCEAKILDSPDARPAESWPSGHGQSDESGFAGPLFFPFPS
jgi:hypothetical protein